MPALPQAPQLQVLSQGQFLEAQQSHSQGREDSGNSSCLWTFSWKPEDLPSFSWASLTLHNARCPHPSLFQPWHQVTYYYNNCLKKVKKHLTDGLWFYFGMWKLISIIGIIEGGGHDSINLGYVTAGWQKLSGGAKGNRRKIWTQTKGLKVAFLDKKCLFVGRIFP